jgi:hypothetical protein
MARTRSRLTPGPDAPPAEPAVDPVLSGLLAKAGAVVAKVAGMKRDVARAKSLAHRAEVREALTRTELSAALNETLAARAELETRLRAEIFARYLDRARPVRLRRHNRPSRLLDKVLSRLGPWGQARVIARSGVWRGRAPGAIAAYVRRGGDPTARPDALFDQAWHLERNSDLVGGRLAPLTHYLLDGAREGRSPHPLFDEAHYRAANRQALGASGLSGLEHYLRAGAARGRDPHPLFDIAYYLGQSPDLAPGEDPLSHYLREGAGRGLTPHPLFDPAWYAEQVGAPLGTANLVHYLSVGSAQGLSPHPLFDSAWYRGQTPEVDTMGLDPLVHFVFVGAADGRQPSPWFDPQAYVESRGGDLAPGANPLIDYLQGGAWAVADARPGSPTAAYLASRPELARAGLTPLEHWVRRAGR